MRQGQRERHDRAVDEHRPHRLHVVQLLLGRATRLEIGRRLGLIDESAWRFVWIVDAPLFEPASEAVAAGDVAVGSGAWTAVHHAFTSPKPDSMDTFDTDPGSALAYAYDIVCNGNEIGGGSIRIHQRSVQERVFEIMGLDEAQAREKFGFLLDAFGYGAPPHGGIAFGWDRICALLSGADSIRDVIAFPKSGGGYDPLTAAPAPITPEQRKEAGVDAKPEQADPGSAGSRGQPPPRPRRSRRSQVHERRLRSESWAQKCSPGRTERSEGRPMTGPADIPGLSSRPSQPEPAEGDGVANPRVRAAVEAFAEAPSAEGSMDVLRACLQGALLLDITGSDITLTEDGTAIAPGSTVQVAYGSGPDGEPAGLAYTSQAELARAHPDGAAGAVAGAAGDRSAGRRADQRPPLALRRPRRPHLRPVA